MKKIAKIIICKKISSFYLLASIPQKIGIYIIKNILKL